MKKRGRIKKDVRLGFFQLAEDRILHFKRLNKKKTANNYICALKYFKQFLGKDILLDDLSVGLLKDFQAYLVSVGLGMNTISLYNRQLRAIYNYALDEEIIHTDRRPFRKSFTGQEKTRKRAVSKETIKKLNDCILENKQHLEFARDMFLFSIYMQGMPFVDIAHLKKEQMKNGYISYKRKKTNQYLKIMLHEKAKEIIEKYKTDVIDCPYIFPILYSPKKNTYVEYSSALRTHNSRLRKISQLIGLEEWLTSYVARHTWASQARECGIRDTIISEAMGHNNLETTKIYLTSIDNGIIASANFQVISSLYWIQT